MRSLVVLIPGDLEGRTGGYGYDRRIIAGLREIGWTVDVRPLDASYPYPTAAAREEASCALAAICDDCLVLIDGLAFGAMAEEAERESARLKFVALVHHPLAAETGVPAQEAAALEQSERRALACARLVVVTSRATVGSLRPYHVSPNLVAVVEPGTDRVPIAQGSSGGPLHLLSVASVTPRKGHQVLIAALATLRDAPWQLTLVGSLDRAPSTARQVQAAVAAADLGGRVVFRGELNEEAVADCYDRADVFVLPAFHEGYGMAVAEALARGVPVVATPTGGIPDLVGEDAGLLVPIGDAAALAQALRDVMTNDSLRLRLTHGARRRRLGLPSWDDAAVAMSAALDQVAGVG